MMTKSILKLAAVFVLPCAGRLAYAQSNGGFSDPLEPDWEVRGAVSIVTLNADSSNTFCLLAEDQSGGLSQIHQDFTLPASPPVISFRFRFIHGVPSEPSPLPPDSFCAYFVDTDNDRLVGSAADPPDFTPAFLYMDSNGAALYDPSYVIVADQADVDGFLAVTLALPDSPYLSGQARIIFALNTASNGVTSAVMIDDVATTCPPGWCCDSDYEQLTLIGDENPCTDDVCTDGVVTHPQVSCPNCAECYNAVGHVVIMLDTTTSTSETDLAKERAAAKELLDIFSGAATRPRVAIGHFDGPCVSGQNCYTEVLSGLDEPRAQDYLDDSVGGEDLYDVIDGITDRHGGTNIKKAIEVAQAELEGNAQPGIRNYIVLITDGWATFPKGDCPDAQGTPGCAHISGTQCDCYNARECARLAAEAARASSTNTEIFGLHFVGTGDTCATLEGGSYVGMAIDWMKDDLLGDPTHFIDAVNADGLLCTFYDVVQFISCDDGISSTKDCCINGQCKHGADCIISE